MESLDNILSGKGEVAPEPETKSEEVVAPVSAETQAPTEPQDEVIEQGGRKMVPLEALTETRGKVKRYTEQVAEFERKLADQAATFDRRMSEVLQAVRQPAPPPKEEAPPTDWFQDPDVAFRQRGEALINPVVGQLRTISSELAQMKAERVFGDKFSDFMAHVTEATKKGDPEVKALEAMMDASPQPYVVAKEWFEKRTFDPAAKEAEIEARILAKYGIAPGTEPPAQQQVQTPVMPSNLAGARNVGNRSAGPAWAGPTPLTDIFKR
jgi:hypothetical protein